MCALKTLMLPSLYLDSFAAGSLLIFTHKCPGVIKSQLKYFLCRQYLSACLSRSQGNVPSDPDSLFQTRALRKIRENYVNDTAPAESSVTLDPEKDGSCGVGRGKGGQEVGGGWWWRWWCWWREWKGGDTHPREFPSEICGLSQQF